MPVKSPMQGQDRLAKSSASKSRDSKSLHPRNLHNQGYDFTSLVAVLPKLSQFVRPNPYGNLSIDFASSEAVKTLNAALLKLHYHIDKWDIPAGFLCPPIPGRVDYLHYIADLLAVKGKVPKGAKIHALDIGTGANGIYPLLGIQCYGWQFTASDIDAKSLRNVVEICAHNPEVNSKLKLVQQTDAKAIFTGVISPSDRIDITLCNPPFHQSLDDAIAGNQRKLSNLAANRAKKHSVVSAQKNKSALNFGGQKAELWCEGGEIQFLRNMITESCQFKHQVLWFSSLVSKSDNLKPCYKLLEKCGAETIDIIEMHQGNKQTRILVWSFLSPALREQWAKFRL
ncbi:23S rRNA (adenine(1618)-N(6))-methyltransferase RlmF [Shewanella sp. OMA3-2]|uniref:23S rRNA (adenine(1618)-N(6))-methyltransferase RlmF n=1 Tax=Shewanella sp. OMA3-2 TaxID=2908650 RepID=UPI001F1C073F|nr:23S rRNA (adenine(1618)-N(6))-methyltransferase RlmF [Shewanella sp. OMA3-2]UJF22207.1 23S rRNA (adenine(1618)-N(6))-methyltransferase RlmF [Shewanella sp. OMA3-2]